MYLKPYVFIKSNHNINPKKYFTLILCSGKIVLLHNPDITRLKEYHFQEVRDYI